MTHGTEAQTLPSGDRDEQAGANDLFAAWERRARLWGRAFAVLTLVVSSLVALAVIRSGQPVTVTLVAAVAPAVGVYWWQTRKLRRRQAIRREPFPPEWEAVLQRDVLFFRALEPDAQQRFRRHIQVFLGEKRITGIRVRIDATTRVLIAASATIPVFGFPDWEWDQINEVLVYPTRFDGDFEFGDKQGHNILGMVGTGSLNRLMILSKPDLINGFRNATDKRNVSVHEFAHLVDKTDGAIDGVPGVGLDREAVGPWIDLVRRKMAEIEAGKSDIDRYAADERGRVLRRHGGVLLRATRRDAPQAPGALRGTRACVQPELARTCRGATARAGPRAADIRTQLAVPVREWTQV